MAPSSPLRRLFLLALGISVLSRGGLPRWLGGLALALGVLQLAGPIGVYAFLGGLALILVMSVRGMAGVGRHAAPARERVPGRA